MLANPGRATDLDCWWLGAGFGLLHAVQVYWCILCINPPSRFVHDYVFHHLYGFLWLGSSGVWISDVIFWCPSNGKWSASPPHRQMSLPHCYPIHYLLDTCSSKSRCIIQVHSWQVNPSSAIQHLSSKREVTPNLFWNLSKECPESFLPLVPLCGSSSCRAKISLDWYVLSFVTKLTLKLKCLDWGFSWCRLVDLHLYS